MHALRQAALTELGHLARVGCDLPVLMRLVASHVARALAIEYCAVWELRADGDDLVLRAGVGWSEDAVGQAVAAASLRSSVENGLLDAAPLVVADWASETRFDQLPLVPNPQVTCSIYAVIPLRAGAFGVLSADGDTLRPFADEETMFLQAVANFLGLAMEYARSNQSIEGRVEERTRKIERRLVAAAQEKAVLEERQRLARDLHDSVTQALYGVTLYAEAATRLLAAGDVATTADYLRVLQETAQEALDEMRLLIFELRPPILEQDGLVAALQARLGAVEGRAHLQTQLLVEGVADLPSVVEQALYRIAQETLNNALKHAHARRITVHLRQLQRSLVLDITDDGVGFDPDVASVAGGMGLRGVAERVAQLKGRLTVHSAVGEGTRLRVEITL
jgi:signal transduction histidine kinase